MQLAFEGSLNLRDASNNLVTTNNMSGTAKITTDPIPNLDKGHLAAIQLVWTGTPVGSFKLTATLDEVNWDDTGVNITAPAGTTGHVTISMSQVPFKNMRVEYTNASGTGTLTAFAIVKGGPA